MKQIVTIIKDCRDCPNYFFMQKHPGGIEFLCGELMKNLFIPYDIYDIENKEWIHKECSLKDVE